MKYRCGGGNTATLPAPVRGGNRAVPDGHRIPLGSMRRPHGFEFPRSVVVIDVRLHGAAGAAVFIHRHANPRIVIKRGIRLIGAHDGTLLNKRAAGEEEVVYAAVKNAQRQSVEGNIQAIAFEFRVRGSHFEIAQETARALRVAGWKIEELVESSPTLACRGAVHGLSPADHNFAVHRDRRDQGLGGIERELRAARAAGFVFPIDHGRIRSSAYRDRARTGCPDIEGNHRCFGGQRCREQDDDRFHVLTPRS